MMIKVIIMMMNYRNYNNNNDNNNGDNDDNDNNNDNDNNDNNDDVDSNNNDNNNNDNNNDNDNNNVIIESNERTTIRPNVICIISAHVPISWTCINPSLLLHQVWHQAYYFHVIILYLFDHKSAILRKTQEHDDILISFIIPLSAP